MTNLEWEEGKTYRIKPEMADDFMRKSYHNTDIFNIIKSSKITPTYVDHNGRVFGIEEHQIPSFITYWFKPEEIKYFDLVEHTEEEQEMTSTKTEQEIVVEWLEKLHYVMRHDDSVHENMCLYADGLVLPTDLCDIYDAVNIFDFVDGHYKHMKAKAEVKRKKELLDKRAALELELAQINKELGE